MKKIFLGITLILSHITYSQDLITPTSENNFLLKFSPLGLIDLQSTLWLSGEYRQQKNNSWQISLGYIFYDYTLKNSIGNIDGEIKLNYAKVNINSRIEYRYYFSQNKERDFGWYLAPQLFFKNIHYNAWDSVCFKWELKGNWFTYYGCTNKQYDEYKVNRLEYGVNMLIGRQIISNNKRIVWDFYSGLGLRKIKIYTFGKAGIVMPEGESLIEINIDFWPAFFYENFDELMPNLVLGFRVAYLFRK